MMVLAIWEKFSYNNFVIDLLSWEVEKYGKYRK